MNTLNTLHKLNDTSLEEQFCNFWHDVDEGNFELVTRYGLCYNFKEYVLAPYCFKNETVDDFLVEVFKLWPKYSGNEEYPIKVSSNPISDYNRHMVMFNKSTEYGRLRWELFEFIYDVCSARLKLSEYK